MSRELKGEERALWKNKLKEAKKDNGWYFLIGKSILIRRIPHNFEVVHKEHCISNYYGTLQGAVECALSMAVEDKIKDKHTIEELISKLSKFDKLINATLAEIKSSVYSKLEAAKKTKSTEGKYYCSKCNKYHDPTKKKGQLHKKYAEEEE